MINSSNLSQNTMASDGYSDRKKATDVKQFLFYTLIFLYFFLGKWNIFTIFRVSTDYLFWAFIAGLLGSFLVFEHKVRLSREIIPVLIYLLYQSFEMHRSAYSSTALQTFIFNILTLWVFVFVKGREGYEKTFLNCLYYGGLYYAVTVVLQAAFPSVVNRVREGLLTSVDVAFGLRGYENTTRYLSGLASNSAVAAFFISMMVAICASRFMLNNQRFKHAVIAGVGMVTLFLTQKRSLALGTVLAVVVIVLFFRRGIARKFRFLMGLFIVGSVAVYIMYRVMPAMTIFLNRLFQNQDILSGRNWMYDEMMVWFQSNKLLGAGIGTANYVFGYGGHNCYRQLLGEEGIIGCVIYGLLVIPYLVSLFWQLFTNWNSSVQSRKTEPLLSASICLVIILIYALVGNPFYDFTFCLTLFMVLAVPTQICGENL